VAHRRESSGLILSDWCRRACLACIVSGTSPCTHKDCANCHVASCQHDCHTKPKRVRPRKKAT
jgi:hypothetical protein